MTLADTAGKSGARQGAPPSRRVRADPRGRADQETQPVTTPVTVGVIANPASGRDIRRLTSHPSVFPTAEKANMVVRLLAGLGALGVARVITLRDRTGVAALVL